MRLLMLGGTRFVGRAVVADALARGWSVTTFTRGVSGAAPPGVQQYHGDRMVAADLAVLAGRRFDVVVDTWTGAPRAVRDSARMLASSAGRYVYVSSRSVYRAPLPAGASEDAPVVESDPDSHQDNDYAAAKAGGELAAVAAFGDRALLARAGLILGPGEDVGRLPWWLRRMARGGRVLAPGPPDLPLQCIDARDLAAWLLDCAEDGIGGAYNAVSEPGHTTMGRLLEHCRRATGSVAELVWADPDPILAAGVQPWTDLPIWIPPGHPDSGLHAADTAKARAAGLRCRPVEDTVDDTWAWLRVQPGDPPQRPDRAPVGLDPATERRILAMLDGRAQDA